MISKLWASLTARLDVAEVFIYEGHVIPRGYGVAYWDARRRYAVCYRIPLNLIVRYGHHLFWRWAINCQPSLWEREMERAYQAGRSAGKGDALGLLHWRYPSPKTRAVPLEVDDAPSK